MSESYKLLKGNEAIAEAALRAGCRFYAGYPITPQSEILEYMADNMEKRGGVFIQGENEIASMSMLYGAAACGARCMSSSSGPGFDLKVLAFTTPKGSSGTGLIILEQIRTGCAPAAIINLRSDPVVLTGPIIAKRFYGVDIPVVNLSEEDYAKLEGAKEVEFHDDRDEIDIYYE